MQKKIFWMVFTILGLLADFLLPLWWAVAATILVMVGAGEAWRRDTTAGPLRATPEQKNLSVLPPSCESLRP